MKRLAMLIAAATAVAALPAQATDAAVDTAEVASKTFILGCVAHYGALDQLRDKLQPGHDLYLPQLPAAEARPFLHGRPGEVYVRPDAGVSLALIKADDECVVFVRKVHTDKLYRQLEKDLRVAVGESFTVRAGGKETKGAMTAQFIDLLPAGEYRAELLKRYGSEPAGMRAILTSSETANPDLQAIITIGTRQP